MGGPCMCNGKPIKAGTDNFEIVPFTLNGVQYWSAEQAYQALKMVNKADREKIAKAAPKKAERSWDHGMRVWQAGQLGKARLDWEAVKVEAMYFANRCKLEQNPDVLALLLESNGAPAGEITHRGSGKFWDQWNPIILMLIREELRTDGRADQGRISALRAAMEEYRLSRNGMSIIAELEAQAQPQAQA